MGNPLESRTYRREDCAVFRKTAEAFGGLSNMAPGFPVRINGIRILTVEALYQACRFPHRPEVQRKIIEQTSPMTAKMVGKPFRDDSRADWDRVRVKIMRWVLRVKLSMHWTKFSELLLSTGDRPIVEDSRKDDFWGAIPTDGTTLIGMNVLGRLLMELREEIKQGKELRRVEPPSIPEFLLFDEAMGAVDFRNDKSKPYVLDVEHAKNAVHDFSLPLFGNDLDMPPSESQTVVVTQPIVVRGNSLTSMLEPYGEYKESGSKWLGDVPAKWEVRNLRTLISKRAERDRADLPLLSVARERGVFVRSLTDADENHNVIPDDLSNYKVARAGNLVINKMKAWQGSMGIAPCDGIVSPAYFVFDFRMSNHAFGQKLLRSKPYVAHFGQASDGVRVGQWDLSIPGMRQIPVLVPSEDEQAAIVKFLDHANRKIDGFIRAKRKLIALLNEQKQAIIHRAVTRGLNPDAKLKPSGIPWLGDIPAHWERIRLKFEASHIVDCLHATPTYRTDGAFPAIRTADIEPGKVRLEQARKISSDEFQRWTARLKPEMGDILYSREGERFGIAANVPADTSLCISQRMMVFRIRKRQNSEYLMWQLNCRHVYLQASLYVIGSTAPHVNIDQIKNFQLALPPVDEQKAIVGHIRAECSIIDTAIARTEREIALMQEYRIRLTSDIVTGKLDVREATAKLPDLSPDTAPEPIADEALEDIETEEN